MTATSDGIDLARTAAARLWRNAPRQFIDFDELVNVCWIGVHRGMSSFIPSDDHPTPEQFAWVCGYREGLTWCRKVYKSLDKRAPELLEDDSKYEPDMIADMAVEEILDELSPQQRQVLVLRLQGLGYEEIGKIMQCRKQYVYALINKAAVRLREKKQCAISRSLVRRSSPCMPRGYKG